MNISVDPFSRMRCKLNKNIWWTRGDHKEPDRRCPIAAKLIAGMLETAGTHQVQPKYDLFQNIKKKYKKLIPKHLEIKRKRQVLV